MRSASLSPSSSSSSSFCMSCAMSFWSSEGCLGTRTALGLMPSACRMTGHLPLPANWKGMQVSQHAKSVPQP